jgi:hypothetical protein
LTVVVRTDSDVFARIAAATTAFTPFGASMLVSPGADAVIHARETASMLPSGRTVVNSLSIVARANRNLHASTPFTFRGADVFASVRADAVVHTRDTVEVTPSGRAVVAALAFASEQTRLIAGRLPAFRAGRASLPVYARRIHFKGWTEVTTRTARKGIGVYLFFVLISQQLDNMISWLLIHNLLLRIKMISLLYYDIQLQSTWLKNYLHFSVL